MDDGGRFVRLNHHIIPENLEDWFGDAADGGAFQTDEVALSGKAVRSSEGDRGGRVCERDSDKIITP